MGHNYCYAYLAGFTALFLLPGERGGGGGGPSRLWVHISMLWFPGWAPQWLSYLWYLSDGRIRRKSLTWTHVLHLGIFRRLVRRNAGQFEKDLQWMIPISPPTGLRRPAQTVGVHVPGGRGCVRIHHAAGRRLGLASAGGPCGHPP